MIVWDSISYSVKSRHLSVDTVKKTEQLFLACCWKEVWYLCQHLCLSWYSWQNQLLGEHDGICRELSHLILTTWDVLVSWATSLKKAFWTLSSPRNTLIIICSSFVFFSSLFNRLNVFSSQQVMCRNPGASIVFFSLLGFANNLFFSWNFKKNLYQSLCEHLIQIYCFCNGL